MKATLFTYTALATAIIFETAGTTFLQKSQQFTKPLPTLLMGLCYLATFYFFSHALKAIPVGLAYAIWSGAGIILISAIGYFIFHQTLDFAAVLGLGFIITGVIIVNTFSKSIPH